MSAFTSLFAKFWDLFTSLRVPILNISFASLYLGVFVVTLSIRLLFPLFGIGASGVSNLLSSRDRATRRKMEKEKLDAWRKNHKRLEKSKHD